MWVFDFPVSVTGLYKRWLVQNMSNKMMIQLLSTRTIVHCIKTTQE